MSDRIFLNSFTMNTPGHLSPGVWRHPHDAGRRTTDLDTWVELAQTLDRGGIDAMFLADVLGVYDVYGGGPEAALRGGVQLPARDPLSLVSAMAHETSCLGFGVTASVSFEHPFPFARRMSTLDHLTGGRIGWNVVTSYLNSGALNLGMSAQQAHDQRYEIAEEYLEVVYRLWEHSWEDDAVLADPDSGVYTDPAKVHPIAFSGEYFNVPGIHLVEPSPQRTPFLFQAGASKRGIAFAARHAEHIFVAAPSQRVLGGQVRALRDAVAEAGRADSRVAVLNQQTVIVAETDREAHQRYEEYLELASPEGALALMSGWTGIDFAELDPDEPLVEQPSEAIQSAVRAFSAADPSVTWTPRQIADFARIGGDGPVLVGSAETVADHLETWVEETGVDGFNLAAAAIPETFESITGLLIPELRRRGRMPQTPVPGTLRARLTGTDRLRSDHPAVRAEI